MDETMVGMNNNNDFKLEFQRLKAYYNFRLKIKKKLKEENNNKYDNEQYYLVDKKWLNNWKKHVGYTNICQERYNINSYSKEINDEDYDKIEPLLKIFCNQNTIFPLVNNEIYANGEINPISDFIFTDKNCFDSFASPNFLNENNKSFPIMFFNGNFLIKFNPNQFLLCFKVKTKDKDEKEKEKEKETFWELIVNLIENVDENNIINNFSNLVDILDWLKKFDFDINSTESEEVNLYEHKIKLYNKTLFIIKHKNLSNNINPQINNGLKQIINKNNNNISQEDIHEMIMKQTQIINNKNNFLVKEVPYADLNITAIKVEECINSNHSVKNNMNNWNNIIV